MTQTPAPPTPLELGVPWANAFAALGSTFSVPLLPTPLSEPYWVARSQQAAASLNLPEHWLDCADLLQALSGNITVAGTQPVATVYSGHQFGVWAGQLGDGRAILLGETAGLEVQLKGAGLTPFSRMGDGRAVLRSSIREFLCSEAMHALGIPTTRALCVTGSDAPVRRETVETAAVVTRVAPSFIRFGHFEHFCHTDQHAELRTLADFVIDRYYPQCRVQAHTKPPTNARSGGSPYAAFLQAVTERTAHMVAQWQAVGFCHGVMNTDNMSILGLTIDYGPFQFLDGYDPGHVCNHSDTQGRYAFYKQPNVAYWNLFCLGQALLPLIGEQDQAIAALETFKAIYPQAFASRMAAKLGFAQASAESPKLVEEVLALLAAEKVDYSIFWRRLSHWAVARSPADHSVRDLFMEPAGIDHWLLSFSELLAHTKQAPGADLMLKTNPKYVLRNHVGELVIRAAKGKDYSQVALLLKVLERPFDEHPEHSALADFPPDWASSIAISCSS